MAILCTCCGRQKRTNETDHIISFDKDLTLSIHPSAFIHPDTSGCSFNVKYITIKNNEDISFNAVLKWSRKEHSCNPMYHFLSTIDGCNETSKVISAFLDTVNIRKWDVKVVKPVLTESAEMALSAEPFVDDIYHFSTLSSALSVHLRQAAEIISAMNHFSYVYSKGKYVIKSPKGGIDEENLIITLISPSMLSNREGYFGCDDLGSIQKYFFAGHVCNSFCEYMKQPEMESCGEHGEKEYSEMLFTPWKLSQGDSPGNSSHRQSGVTEYPSEEVIEII